MHEHRSGEQFAPFVDWLVSVPGEVGLLQACSPARGESRVTPNRLPRAMPQRRIGTVEHSRPVGKAGLFKQGCNRMSLSFDIEFGDAPDRPGDFVPPESMRGQAKLELAVEIDRETISFGEGEERTAIVRGVNPEKRHEWYTLRGRAAEGDLTPGLVYRFWGRWTNHDKYGWQFAFRHFVKVTPHGRRGVVKYLQKAPGIGPAMASKIYELFGDKSMEFIRDNPSRVSQLVKGFKLEKAEEAAEWLADQMAAEHATIDLLDLLDGRRFPQRLLRELLAKWGNTATDRIKKNPYILLQFRGAGFSRTDRLYLDLGHRPDALKRQALCIHNEVRRRSSETWVPLIETHGELKQKITSTTLNPERATKLAVRGGMLEVRELNGQRWVALKERADDERLVAKKILELSAEVPQWPDMIDADDLSPHQRGQAMTAFRGSVGCLIGTPGTGKTYTIARIVREIIHSFGPGEVAICCPTGKAAVRVTETMAQAGIPIVATTIHKLLAVTGSDGDDWGFAHDHSDPLPFKFIIVDEASMVDCGIAARLLDACQRGTHILFVGDINQLAPVGHGSPLRDFVKAGVPTGELTEIRRNSGKIVQACKNIRDHGVAIFSEKLDIANGDNLVLREAYSATTCAAELDRVLFQIERSGKYDMKWGVQVICAVNKAGDLSRKALNERLQNLLNPNGQRCEHNPFRLGDKIICLKNSRVAAVDPDDPQADKNGKIVVANGELAEVVAIGPRRTVAELQNPYRKVVIYHGKVEKSDEDGEEERSDKGCDWDLGYAISCHKSQGSEYLISIVMLDDSSGASRVCDRAWLYTGISRGKVASVMIGRESTLRDMCARVAIERRTTFVVEYLCGELNEMVSV